MGTNNKNSPSNNEKNCERTFINVSPNNKKSSNGPQQRPTPSKSINIKTPNKNQNLGQKRVGSCSPPNFSFFAASKCFESPSAQSLPKPPTSWFDEGSSSNNNRGVTRNQKKSVRKSLNLSAVESLPSSCASEFAKQQNSSFTSLSNDHYTQQLKFLLNVNA